jgi:hypothetical protein
MEDGAKGWEVMDRNAATSCTQVLVPGRPTYESVFRIRVHRIHMFLGDPDPDPLVTGMDPDPSISKKNIKINLDSYCLFVTSF